MKTATLLLLVFITSALAVSPNASPGHEKLLKTDYRAFQGASKLSPETENRLADAIFILEGGNGTKWPYGIKVRYKSTTPRQACLNTVRHKHADWVKAGCAGDFLDYLADRYCPPSADPAGNKNWKSNIHSFAK